MIRGSTSDIRSCKSRNREPLRSLGYVFSTAYSLLLTRNGDIRVSGQFLSRKLLFLGKHAVENKNCLLRNSMRGVAMVKLTLVCTWYLEIALSLSPFKQASLGHTLGAHNILYIYICVCVHYISLAISGGSHLQGLSFRRYECSGQYSCFMVSRGRWLSSAYVYLANHLGLSTLGALIEPLQQPA